MQPLRRIRHHPDRHPVMKRHVVTGAAIGTIVLLTGAQGGCGNGSSKTSSTSVATHVEVQGNPASAHKCKTTLSMPPPTRKQLVATYSVTCNFPIASASTSLVIQARPVGGDNTSWDNVDDPKVSSATSSIWLSYTVPCVTKLEYQASASIDAAGADGTPVNTSDTTTPRSYGASECSGS